MLLTIFLNENQSPVLVPCITYGYSQNAIISSCSILSKNLTNFDPTNNKFYLITPVRPSICTFLSALEISGPCSQSECCRSSPAISQVTPLGLLFRFVRKILGFSCKILLNPASKTVMASYANAPVAVIP